MHAAAPSAAAHSSGATVPAGMTEPEDPPKIRVVVRKRPINRKVCARGTRVYARNRKQHSLTAAK
jgi:hypothetical protein